jgi:hypothetical protein
LEVREFAAMVALVAFGMTCAGAPEAKDRRVQIIQTGAA